MTNSHLAVISYYTLSLSSTTEYMYDGRVTNPSKLISNVYDKAVCIAEAKQTANHQLILVHDCDSTLNTFWNTLLSSIFSQYYCSFKCNVSKHLK